jgi:hypothetical protein
MKNSYHPPKQKQWEEIIHRPELPEGWFCLEQETNVKASSTSFVRWGKIHHNAEPQMIWVVFIEHNPKYYNHRFVVRGGLHAKGHSGVIPFEDVKPATKCMIEIMEATDRWLEEINSEKYIKSYNDKIASQIRAEEKRKKELAELYG